MIRKRRGRKIKPLDDLFIEHRTVLIIVELINVFGIEIVYYSRYLDNILSYIIDKSRSNKYSKYLYVS